MSAILPPSNRLRWKQPLDKVEWAWIAVAVVWGMVSNRTDNESAKMATGKG